MKTVKVNLSLLSTTEGGRQIPISPLRDFGCPVFFKDVPSLSGHGYDCRILMRQFGKEIHPGETVQDILMAFLSSEDVLPHIKEGTKFDLWESGRVGDGEIVSINE